MYNAVVPSFSLSFTLAFRFKSNSTTFACPYVDAIVLLNA